MDSIRRRTACRQGPVFRHLKCNHMGVRSDNQNVTIRGESINPSPIWLPCHSPPDGSTLPPCTRATARPKNTNKGGCLTKMGSATILFEPGPCVRFALPNFCDCSQTELAS